MKRTLYLVVLLMLPSLLYAQKHAFYVSGSAAYGLANISNNFQSSNVEIKGATYASGIVAATYMLTDHVGLSVGVGSEMVKYKLSDVIAVPGSLEGREKMQYLVVPVYVSFVTGTGHKPCFFANAGIQTSMLLSGKEGLYIDGEKVEDFDIKEYSNKLIISPYLAAGVKIPLTKRILLDLGPQFHANVINMYKDKDTKAKSMPIAFRLGVNVRLGS